MMPGHVSTMCGRAGVRRCIFLTRFSCDYSSLSCSAQSLTRWTRIRIRRDMETNSVKRNSNGSERVMLENGKRTWQLTAVHVKPFSMFKSAFLYVLHAHFQEYLPFLASFQSSCGRLHCHDIHPPFPSTSWTIQQSLQSPTED